MKGRQRGRGEDGRGGVKQGVVGRGKGKVDFCAAHPKQSTAESEWSDNGQLLILVPSQVIHTPLKRK